MHEARLCVSAIVINYISIRKGFLSHYVAGLWICSPECSQLETFQTALTWNSAWRPWKLLLPLGESHRSSTPIRGGQFTSR